MAAPRAGALGSRGNAKIDKHEILAITRQTSRTPHIVEKDYVLGWMLAGIYGHEGLTESWIFKGGTCLKKCFFETYRFSEELDFTLRESQYLDTNFLKAVRMIVVVHFGRAAGGDGTPSAGIPAAGRRLDR